MVDHLVMVFRLQVIEIQKTQEIFYLENKPKEKKKGFNAPARALKTFDWGKKKHT